MRSEEGWNCDGRGERGEFRVELQPQARSRPQPRCPVSLHVQRRERD